jgi:hypothetical protein
MPPAKLADPDPVIDPELVVDPDLAALVAAWPTLPPAVRAGIVAMVRVSRPEAGR